MVPSLRKRNSVPWVMGIGASQHNASVCLLKGQELVIAVQEERLSGIKRSGLVASEASRAVQYCLKAAGITPSDLDLVAVSTAGIPAMNVANDLSLNRTLRIAFNGAHQLIVPHHLAHAASVYATSGFGQAAILIIDGLGSPYKELSEDEQKKVTALEPEGWEHTSLYLAEGSQIRCLEKHLTTDAGWIKPNPPGMPFFASLGGMYSAVSYQIFGELLDAGKVMGLAPYGKSIIPVESFFRYEDGRYVFLPDVPQQFRYPDRYPLREELYCDLAASVQAALECAILQLCSRLQKLSSSKNLCYSGGVALNCTTNELIVKSGIFEDVFIAPASDDSGVAIGAAYYGLWRLDAQAGRKRLTCDSTGATYSDTAVEGAIKTFPVPLKAENLDSQDLYNQVAKLLDGGAIIGWSWGRSELGPRALGHRSILADPREASTRDKINAEIKGRELFRPLAPVIREEKLAEWFAADPGDSSPFMLRTFCALPDKVHLIGAVVHVDNTSRVQTVTPAVNPRLYELLGAFERLTGIPILLNTSFNGPGEPIVETPQDALWSFLELGLDYLVIEGRLISLVNRISILDLVPSMSVRRGSKVIQVADGRISEDSHDGPAWSLEVSNAWGRFAVPISGLAGRIISIIDGHMTCRELLSAPPEAGGVTAKAFKRECGKLRRMGVITFRVRSDHT
jgi:carbamoyltransferase